MYAIMFVWLCFLAQVLSQPDVESPDLGKSQSGSSKYVSDSDAIISSATHESIAERLRFVDEDGQKLLFKFPCGDGPDRGFQFAVALFDKIGEEEDIEKFGAFLVNRTGLGAKECNNGILFVFSRQDRKNYLKGARPVLTDGHAAEILESLKPEMRSGDYDAAIETAVRRIVGEALSKRGPWQYVSWDGSILHWMWGNLVVASSWLNHYYVFPIFIIIIMICSTVSSHIASRRTEALETKLRRLELANKMQQESTPLTSPKQGPFHYKQVRAA